MSEKNGRWSLLPEAGTEGGEHIASYRARGGYVGARRALAELEPAAIVAAVERSGLRGRGGAGFPAAKKWQVARASEESTRYLVANAYDADPAAPIARALLERNPHAVVEGIIIAAYAVGAQEAFVYCRSDNALANRRLRAAIAEAEEEAFLGSGAFQGRWPLTVHTVLGWGGFSGGEETAALEAIEGNRAMPRQKPPYPAEKGLWGRPTVVHSVETLANLPAVLQGQSGAGGKIVALGGDAAHPGLVEVPFGTPLRAVVALGGGLAGGKGLRALQVGGPTGAVLPASLLDTPYDYDALAEIGAFVGSGSVVPLAEDACVVDYARERMAYLAGEACGKCVPCRLGTSRMAITLEGITSNLGRESDLALLEEFAGLLDKGSLCAFGRTAATLLRSTLAHFGEDYRVHIAEKRCPTGRCQPLRTRRFERKRAI